MVYYFFSINGRTVYISAADFARLSEHVTVQS